MGSIPAKTQLPADMEWLFPEYNFAELAPHRHAAIFIERVLERGSWEQLRWLFSRYGEPRVADWVRHHGYRLLSKRSFALWRLALDIEDYHASDWAKSAKEMEPW
jgi:hypothetical protein